MVNALHTLALDWTITGFLTGATTQLRTWGGLIMMLVGVVMVIVAVWQIASGLISHGKKQTNWVVAVLLLLIGGALASFGAANDAWAWVSKISGGGKQTIDSLGGGTTILMLRAAWPF